MILCVTVDNNMGMTFNNRRQSQDKLLRNYLIEMTRKSRLWINNYTAQQFEVPLEGHIQVDDNFLNKAKEGDFCFVENLKVSQYQNRIKKIILFKWNRVYPADTYFDIPLTKDSWELTSVIEFEGNSHKKITKEEWKNENI